MRAGLAKTEPEIIQKWEDIKIHERILKKQEEKPCYFLLDGPPYANASIHLGHVVNKVLKDFVIKYKNLSGFRAPFLPVWDCHGLPIEMATLKKTENKEQKLSKKEIREHCRKEALFWVKTQKDGFKRLGVVAQWDQPVLTMDSLYEAEEVRVLADIVDNGLLYRGNKPVFWCFKLETALAFSEAEYREHKSPSIYVKFDFTPDSQKTFPTTKPLKQNLFVLLYGPPHPGLYQPTLPFAFTLILTMVFMKGKAKPILSQLNGRIFLLKRQE